MSANVQYADFIRRKSQAGQAAGFEPVFMSPHAKPFQRHLCEWSIRRGRAALLEACGLGKSIQELIFSENVVRHTNRPVLIATPLAVAPQMVREANKFDMEARVTRDGTVYPGINVTNYERLHYYNPDDFGGVVGDEIGCIKAFDGKRRKQVTRFLSKVRYRLLATATPAPNDFIELGTIAEALGEMTQSDMLAMFFRSSDNMRHSLFREGEFWNRPKWFFRPHSREPFWRWVCSWARACRSPADLGFDGVEYVLPPLEVTQHVIPSTYRYPGELFPRIARTLKEQRVERKHTLQERCEKVAELVDHGDPVIVWCQLNPEGDLLEKIIPGAVQVAGCNSDEEKEDRLTAFALGQERVLVTKGKIGAWGLNLQHCGHQTYFPSHSWEMWHQGVHRSLRFGRVGRVRIDVVATEGEAGVTANLQKKERQAEEMYAALVDHMNQHQRVEVRETHTKEMEAVPWL